MNTPPTLVPLSSRACPPIPLEHRRVREPVRGMVRVVPCRLIIPRRGKLSGQTPTPEQCEGV